MAGQSASTGVRRGERIAQLLADLSGERLRGARVLDLGCNDWWMGEYFARHDIRCDGVELNKRSYDLALERVERFGRDVVVAQGDLHDAARLLGDSYLEQGKELPFEPDAGYDAVSLFEVFEHVPDIERTLDAMESLVRPGGRLVYAVCSGEPEEGEDVVRGFLASHVQFALAALPGWAAPFGEGGFACTRPERDGGDLFFAAVMARGGP